MCGLAAYVGRGADRTLIHTAVALAANRGDDMYGILDVDGWRTVGLGRLPPTFDPPTRTTMYHQRLATSKGFTLADAQPLVRGEYAVAHNGTVPHHVRHLALDEADLMTENDSEAILVLADAIGISRTIARLERYALVMFTPGGVIAARKSLPLYRHTDPSGTYLSSGAIGQSLADDVIYRVTRGGLEPISVIQALPRHTPWLRAGEHP